MSKSCLTRAARIVLLAVLSAALVGCVSLPEVGPFVDATLQLRSAIVAAGRVTEAEIRRREDLKEQADELHSLWEARVKAADALCAYADSLRQIVDAGQKGREAAGSLADSVKNLAGMAGIPLGPKVVGSVKAAGEFIYGQIALIRASKSLEEALVNARPAVERISEVIAEDFKDLEVKFRAASQLVTTKTVSRYNDELGFRDGLLEELSKKDPASLSTPEEVDRLVKMCKLLEVSEDWYEGYRMEQEQTEKRLEAARELISSAKEAIGYWSNAHKQLVYALRNRRSVNPAALVQVALELGELARRIREL